MKSSNWVTHTIYKYMNSGVSSSKETVDLGLPSEFKDVHIFGYISYVDYIKNIISVNLQKEVYTPSTFSYRLITKYGKQIDKQSITIGDGAGRIPNIYSTASYSGHGFLIYMSIETSGSDGGWGNIKYRYKKSDGIFTDWVTLLSYSKGSPGFIQKTMRLDFTDLQPITKDTVIDISIQASRHGRYGGCYCEYTITPFSYLETEDDTKGKIHWFAFAK